MNVLAALKAHKIGGYSMCRHIIENFEAGFSCLVLGAFIYNNKKKIISKRSLSANIGKANIFICRKHLN